MRALPTFSVILPTCNRSSLLRVALRSLSWQTYSDFEVIVVNDGEEDLSSLERDHARSFSCTFLRTPHPRSGPSAARNTGIRAARGDYLCYLDDDDFYYEEHLELLYETLQRFGHKVVYTDGVQAKQKMLQGEYVTVSRDVHLSYDFDPAMLAGENITPVLTLAHWAGCLKRSGLFAAYLRGHEDWDLWQRMARHYPFLHMKAPTAEYLIREGAERLSEALMPMAESWLFVRRQGLVFYAMPPVFELEQRATGGRSLGSFSTPGLVTLILCAGEAGAFLQNPAAVQSLNRLCASEASGRIRLLLTGWGEAMPLLYQHAARALPGAVACLWFPADPGRLFAANQAAESANSEWLLFLEPFVEPTDSQWLDAMLASARSDPAAGAVGGVMTLPERPALAGGIFSARNDLVFDNKTPALGQESRETPCLSGLCLLIRRDLFLRVGSFDPAFAPWHYADADLCLRLRQRGLSSIIAPGALFAWNRQNSRLVQTPAGLAGRRTFWDRWVDCPFPFERYTTATDWSLRPEDGLGLWPSEGILPRTFNVPVPLDYQNLLRSSGGQE